MDLYLVSNQVRQYMMFSGCTVITSVSLKVVALLHFHLKWTYFEHIVLSWTLVWKVYFSMWESRKQTFQVLTPFESNIMQLLWWAIALVLGFCFDQTFQPCRCFSISLPQWVNWLNTGLKLDRAHKDNVVNKIYTIFWTINLQ